ncbi:MAG: quinolinate synthase NadA [Candidatus Altiarchaeota archaeon]
MDQGELVKDILKLKKCRNAVILAHNYQRPEIQDLGDFVGDSLELARKAQSTESDIIVFCGVDFMAETAAIINPGKTVLIPAWEALCPMAAMLPPETIRQAREENPDAEVVMYVNTTAAAKVYADCICTSANAVKVVNSMDADTILFAPDRNLAYYVAQRTKKRIITVPEKGMCVVHDRITVDDVMAARKAHPNAKVTVHPECIPDVQAIADHIGSTKQMIEYVKTDPSPEYIIGTEVDIAHRMRKEAPDKTFYPACEKAICRNMKKNTLENLRDALLNMQYKVVVPEKIVEKARKPIERMLALK